MNREFGGKGPLDEINSTSDEMYFLFHSVVAEDASLTIVVARRVDGYCATSEGPDSPRLGGVTVRCWIDGI
jgi:hypothetical protein